MNGTLALWFEGVPTTAAVATADGAPDAVPAAGRTVTAPTMRLHVNLWRDLDRRVNFLDVGFLLSEVSFLGRLYLYLPAPILLASLLDLSDALKDADTLNAVFNEVATVVAEEDDYFVIRNERGPERLVHSVRPGKDVTVHRINVPGRGQGTVVALTSALCTRLRNGPGSVEHYVRLRILLKGAARNLFTTEDAGSGVGLSLTQDVLETTEFRLNERRSYPPAILQRATNGRVNLQSVHYFLIRSKNFQLGSQHQNFRKVRYLEHDIWTGYLAVGQNAKWLPFGRRGAKGMVIYQWRDVAEKADKGLDDFIAYASFRTAQPKIIAYVVAVLAIGVVGSAMLNVAVAALQHGYERIGQHAPGAGWLNLYVVIVGLLVVALLPLLHGSLRRRFR